MSDFLLIQNEGEAPVEGYTVLGYSSSRNSGTKGTIGQFGSGAKHAINLALRHGLAVWVYCGKTRLEFSLEKETINDGLRDDTVSHVTYRKNGGAYKRAGWILDFGVLDWDNIGMGLRELVSNAIDRTLKNADNGGLSFEDARSQNHLSIKVVDETDRRAKSGYTRIYIAINDDVREYFGDLHKNFLHFSDGGKAEPGLIPKDDPSPARIYREGVFVREMDTDSLFDYNFTVDEIKIDECRNSSDYAVKAACARKLKDADAPQLKVVFDAQVRGLDTVEAAFDEDYLTGFGSLSETQKDRWKTAWESSAGAEAIVCDSQFASDYAQKKGHPTQQVRPNWSKAIKRAGIRSADDVLSIDEQRGRTRIEATPEQIEATDWAWDVFDLAGLAGGRERPTVFGFHEIMSGQGQTLGFCNNEGVHYEANVGGTMLKKTALEEVAHWITGATDNSRDFQDFFINTLVQLA